MVSASVVDGILQQRATESTDSSKKTSGGSSLGKDDFGENGQGDIGDTRRSSFEENAELDAFVPYV